MLSLYLRTESDCSYSERYRATMFIVEDAVTNPTNPMVRGTTMWKNLSPVASECLQIRVNSFLSHRSSRVYLVMANATKVANTQGGAQSKSVVVRSYPSVAVSVGKNALNEREVIIKVMLHAIDKWTRLRAMMDEVLQSHVRNPPIHQSIEEDFSLALDFRPTFVTDTRVLFHSFLGQSNLHRGQPTMRSGGKVWKNKQRDNGDEYRQRTLDEK